MKGGNIDSEDKRSSNGTGQEYIYSRLEGPPSPADQDRFLPSFVLGTSSPNWHDVEEHKVLFLGAHREWKRSNTSF